MKRIFPLLLLLLLSPPRVEAARGITLDQFLAHPTLQAASVGVVVMDIATGSTPLSYQAHQARTPASVQKLITTATALELYGTEYTFQTQVAYSGGVDAQGMLHGNLYVIGGGDPSLGSIWSSRNAAHFLQSAKAALQRKGIRRVQGNVIADASCYDTEGVSPYWVWEDLGNHYAAGSYGLNMCDNRYTLTLRSGAVGSTPSVVGTEPHLELSFENYLRAANNNRDSAYIYGAPYSSHRALYGTIPAGRAAFSIKGDMPDPPLFVAQQLLASLKRSGISVSGAATTTRITGEKSPTCTPLLNYPSDPLIDLIATTNKQSHNLYAESLLRLIAKRKGASASTPTALAKLQQVWQERGVDCSALLMRDGCGLSPSNALSPQLLAELLRYMALESPHADAFRATLPVAGVSGTVRNLLKNSPLRGHLSLKSGSMGGVQCYAGYLDKSHVVVVMVNHFTGSRAQLQQQIGALLEGICLPLIGF